MPFFLAEFVRRSLRKVDWHRIAALLLELPQGECYCGQGILQDLTGVVVEYLGEAFRITGDESTVFGHQLPEPLRTHVLLLADLCRETTKVLRLSLLDGEKR